VCVCACVRVCVCACVRVCVHTNPSIDNSQLHWERILQPWECRSVLQCVAVCCSVLQCVAVCCKVLQGVAGCCRTLQSVAVCCSVWQCVTACCSVLQRVAVCCSVLRPEKLSAAYLNLPLYHTGVTIHMWHDLSIFAHSHIWHNAFILAHSYVWHDTLNEEAGLALKHMGWLQLVGSLKL